MRQDIAAAVTIASLMAVSSGATAETIEERVARLEQRVSDLTAKADGPVEGSEVHVGGYGELHYNNLSGAGGMADKDELDFHRFVIYLGYDFSDYIRFSSEVELEHSLSGGNAPGKVELEQAFMERLRRAPEQLLTDRDAYRALKITAEEFLRMATGLDKLGLVKRVNIGAPHRNIPATKLT